MKTFMSDFFKDLLLVQKSLSKSNLKQSQLLGILNPIEYIYSILIALIG